MITRALSFLKQYLRYKEMVLTRQEKRDLVLDLYNQGKTYCEIAEEARMSPRDIGVIVNRAVDEKELEIEDKENQAQTNPTEKASRTRFGCFY